MYKKYIAFTLFAIGAIPLAANDGATHIAAFANISNLLNSSKNIFEELDLMNSIKQQMDNANSWLEAQLKTRRSDTLSSVYDRIKYRAGSILTQLRNFNANLNGMKTNSTVLAQFRTKVHIFSEDRDQLKKDLQEDRTLMQFKKHKKPLFRSATREEAKQGIADVLMAYADTFVKIAQKAVTDFARMDGALYIEQEKPGLKMVTPALIDMPKKPASFLMQDSASSTSFTSAADTYEKAQAENSDKPENNDTRKSATWNDWDSDTE